MAKFLTRIELHDASGEDYQVLHRAMFNAGFAMRITGDDGVTYQLPTAEYWCTYSGTAEQVRAIAHRAAATTGKSSWVLTIEYNSAAWNLQHV